MSPSPERVHARTVSSGAWKQRWPIQRHLIEHRVAVLRSSQVLIFYVIESPHDRNTELVASRFVCQALQFHKDVPLRNRIKKRLIVTGVGR